MTIKEDKREIDIMIESEIPMSGDLVANIDIFGTLVVKPGYEKALEVIARLTDYIDFSKYKHEMVHIKEDSIDDLAFNIDRDTESKVKDILAKTVERFGGMIVCIGDIDYSNALVDTVKADKCSKDISRCRVRDYTNGFGFMLMAVAFTVCSNQGTNVEMTWYGPEEEETYYITGDGILRISKDIEYNFN